MAQNIFKSKCLFFNVLSRAQGIRGLANFAENTNIKKSVFVSQSKDIYSNLALEDWMYKNFDFTNHHILMLWQNDPCVVIGRHQNPWAEANIPSLAEQDVKIARRNSGGGTVYHDHGNLNLTFFTPRERYDRKYNLEIIVRALFREYGLTATISPRQDLTLRDSYKQISGTAAKLGRPNAYHHCTLLVDVNKLELSQALQKRQTGIVTNATKSIPSAVMNLTEEYPGMTVESLTEAIGWEYLRTHALSVKDGGKELIKQQKGFQLVNPTDQWFPGLSEIRNQLSSWDWCYGKTPNFSLTRSFPVPNNSDEDLKIIIDVKQGYISDVLLHVPAGLSTTGVQGYLEVITSLKGSKFTEESMTNLEAYLAIDNILAADKDTVDKDKFVMMTSA